MPTLYKQAAWKKSVIDLPHSLLEPSDAVEDAYYACSPSLKQNDHVHPRDAPSVIINDKPASTLFRTIRAMVQRVTVPRSKDHPATPKSLWNDATALMMANSFEDITDGMARVRDTYFGRSLAVSQSICSTA
jgi:hypothetical protein